MEAMILRPISRGAVILLGWVLAPPLLSITLLALGLNVVYPLLVMSILILFPHVWISVRAGFYWVQLWPLPIALAISVLQWVLVAVIYGWLMRRQNAMVQILLAPLAVALVALVVHQLISSLGYQVSANLP